ncbi:PhnD/SsuA/transferrin family substrate-binding protein [Ectothiorhodospira sp. BSL-9]|uniref:substrate-binding domain-containing protein n=1 Tax=Ectothiorhodospira sp. BSL-9 TaxID=1442136 RepID=UPI0009ED6DC8|nr:PhnD/SsuA/transferrin family substrate-binding protein [Ectothiorhodospira sp. BSL-9]
MTREFTPRRRFLKAAAGVLAVGMTPWGSVLAEDEADTLRIGLTPVFLDDQAAFLQRWREDLSRRLGRPVRFVQRASYREVTELLLEGRLDAAWLCGFPYVLHEDRLRLLAVPLYRGQPRYRSYLLVPASDTRTRSLMDLEGQVFAFSDPLSNSGHLFVQYRLMREGQGVEHFFRRSFFTWSHRKVIEATAVGLAQGGAVDSYVWETLAQFSPRITDRTRVVERSPPFGFPPFVTRKDLPERDFQALRSALVDRIRDPETERLMSRLNLDGFIPGEPELFDEIRRMAQALGRI